MLGWLRERRRRRIREQPFPPEWDAIIAAYVPLASDLAPTDRARLRELIQVFIAEKYWEGCGGLELTETMQVVVAANACLLVLGRGDLDLYKDVESILLYPTTIVTPPRKPFVFENVRTPIGHGHTISGEAMLHGPVVLAWDSVLASAHWAATSNVVLHELAHKLDMADGHVDGTPPLPTDREIAEWARVWTAAYHALQLRLAYGVPTVIDPYGATNEAELFAVATETYFLQPAALRAEYPELFEQLQRFYHPHEARRQWGFDRGLARQDEPGGVKEEPAVFD